MYEIFINKSLGSFQKKNPILYWSIYRNIMQIEIEIITNQFILSCMDGNGTLCFVDHLDGPHEDKVATKNSSRSETWYL